MTSKLLIYLFFGIAWTNIQATVPVLSFSINDSLPESSYEGQRLYISNIGIYQVKPNWMRIQYVATNTGSQTIDINKRKPSSSLKIRFDESLTNNHLEDYADQIRKVLVLQKIKLSPGEQTDTEYVKFYTNAAKYQQEEEITKIVKNVPSAQVYRNSPPQKKTEPKNEPKESKSSTKGLSSSSAASPPARISTEDLINEKENCPDLIIGNINVIQKTKRYITLEYTITNQGKGQVNLFGTEETKEDNAVIVAYMSGSPKLSRGAINLKGEYITEGIGLLKANESQKGNIKLDIRSQTRYTPVIILSLDAFRVAKECDRTNNTTHIVIQ